MTEVRFYDDPPDERLRFAVILAVHNGKWVFCRHKARQTYELPGGRRETGETVCAAARRERAPEREPDEQQHREPHEDGRKIFL